MYRPALFVHYNWQIDDLPFFAKINDIIIISSQVLLNIDFYETEGRNEHVMAYRIKPMHQSAIILLSECVTHQVYISHKYIGDNCLYIYMRSYVEKV